MHKNPRSNHERQNLKKLLNQCPRKLQCPSNNDQFCMVQPVKETWSSQLKRVSEVPVRINNILCKPEPNKLKCAKSKNHKNLHFFLSNPEANNFTKSPWSKLMHSLYVRLSATAQEGSFTFVDDILHEGFHLHKVLEENQQHILLQIFNIWKMSSEFPFMFPKLQHTKRRIKY